jgi:3',5'-cyclic AMP phosphodiesterase CpdA
MRVVQLSDLHLCDGLLYSGIDPWRALALALVRIDRLRPRADVLLLSGDLADDGNADTYRRLAELLARGSRIPALLPGNHDDRAGLWAAFPNQAWRSEDFLCQRIDRGEVTLLLLDTLIPGREDGRFTAEHVAWLDAVCPHDRRVLLAMHHPPCAVGIAGMDVMGCAGAELLAQWLSLQPQVDVVEAVLCGHVHRHVTQIFAGHLTMTCPSTVHQIALQDGPLAWTPEAPGLLVHDLLPGQALRTHALPLATAEVHGYDEVGYLAD